MCTATDILATPQVIGFDFFSIPDVKCESCHPAEQLHCTASETIVNIISICIYMWGSFIFLEPNFAAQFISARISCNFFLLLRFFCRVKIYNVRLSVRVRARPAAEMHFARSFWQKRKHEEKVLVWTHFVYKIVHICAQTCLVNQRQRKVIFRDGCIVPSWRFA